MPFEIGDTVYALKTLNEGPSGDSPGQHFCEFGDLLIVRDTSTLFGGGYQVSHEHRTDGRTFFVHGWEISYMKHFDHNKPFTFHQTWGPYYL